MSQAEELLNSLSTSSRIADTIVEGHIVIDENRVVHVPNELKRIAVQNDHNIETVTFDCPRYWDGIDMSEMVIYINYKLPDETKGRYIATNIRIDENDRNLMHFDWTIMNYMTVNRGNITFLVCIVDPEEVGLPKDVTFNTVIYAKDKYIAAGNNVVYYSEDGVIWNEGIINSNSGGSDIITDVACSDDEFLVAIGSNGTQTSALYSYDGIEWTEIEDLNIYSIKPKAITYGNGRFVAIGENSGICYSEDGITWTNHENAFTATFTCLTYGNGVFIAGSTKGIYYSVDKLPTSMINLYDSTNNINNVYHIMWTGTRFLAFTENGLLGSYDGKEWTKLSDTPELNSPKFAAFVDGKIRVIDSDDTLYNYVLDVNHYCNHILDVDSEGSTYTPQSISIVYDEGSVQGRIITIEVDKPSYIEVQLYNGDTEACEPLRSELTKSFSFYTANYDVAPSILCMTFKIENYNGNVTLLNNDAYVYYNVSLTHDKISFDHTINSLTYHDGKYIAVGRNLDMYYSLNGTDWGLPEAPISRHWNSELNKEMYVSEGMECEDGTVISPSSDIVAQLVARMDSVFRNVSNGKQSLASAIADKGISIDADATFEEIANQLTNEMYKVTTMNAVHTSHIELSESEVQVIE